MAKRDSLRATPISSAEARASFGAILERAAGKKRERFVVRRRGKAEAVIMGIEDYLSLIAPTPPVMAEIRSYAKAHGGEDLTMEEIDAEIAAFRKEQRELNANRLGGH